MKRRALPRFRGLVFVWTFPSSLLTPSLNPVCNSPGALGQQDHVLSLNGAGVQRQAQGLWASFTFNG